MASPKARRFAKAATTVLVAGLIVALSSALTFTSSVEPLADSARRLDDVDLAIGSAAVTRLAAAQAVVFAIDQANETATPEALSLALAEATANLDAYEAMVATVAAHPDPPELTFLDDLAEQGRTAVELLYAGQIDEARTIVNGSLEDSYRAAVAELTSLRLDLAARIDSATNRAAQLSNVVRTLVSMGIPIAVGLIALSWARSRVARARWDADAELYTAREQLRKKDERLAEISHRFRTPLTSIFGFSDILARTKRFKGLDRELIALINAESADLFRIAEDVLASAQLEADTMDTEAAIVALGDVIDEAVKPAIARGVDVKVDCPELWVVSDGAKVRQILRNLVSNAAEHGAEPIFVEAEETDGVVSCSVIDHGAGLEQDPAAAFSSGLGLQIAFSLAQLIETPLEYRRHDDRTQFTLWFSEDGPANDPPGAERAPTRPDARPMPVGGTAEGAAE